MSLSALTDAEFDALDDDSQFAALDSMLDEQLASITQFEIMVDALVLIL